MTTISFFKYKKNKFWAFAQMGKGYDIFTNVKGLSFVKLLGTGAGAGFSLYPDFSTYSILCVWKNEKFARDFIENSQHSKIISEKAYSRNDYFLNTIQSHGLWDGSNPFNKVAKFKSTKNKIGIITRANLNMYRILEFWSSVPKASNAIKKAKGVSWYKGIGEWPLIQQATFSVWESIEHVKNFAYGDGLHKDIVQKTKRRNWYKEDLFARFEILNSEYRIFYSN